MANNNKMPFSKLFVRCAKDNGRYIQLIQYIKNTTNKTPILSTVTIVDTNKSKQNKELQQLKTEIFRKYPSFVKENEYINEFSLYIANNVIGQDYCYTLFKKFIIQHYGKKYFQNYETYVNTQKTYRICTMAEEQIRRFQNTLQLNDEQINEIIKKQQTQKYLAPFAYLYYGFEWKTTTEGFDFWCNINKKWIDYMLSYIINNIINK